MALDNHNFFPKAMPQHIKNVELVQGNGEVGTIKQTNFHEGHEVKYAKHRMDEIDVDNYAIRYTLIDTNLFGEKLESIKYEIKLEPSRTGSLCMIRVHLNTKGDCEIKEDKIVLGKEKEKGMFKAAEEYLLANPDVYA